jgi:DNA-binding SARP family transcriptional activator
VLAAVSDPALAVGVRGAVRVQLLKGFQVLAGDRPIPLPSSSERLIALLSLNERPLRRNSVAGLLWADITDDRAGGNLRTTIWRTRRPGFDLIQGNGSVLALSPGVLVDVRDMTSQASRLLSGTCSESDYDRTPLVGDLLPFWDDEWVVIERERLRQLRLHALECLCVRLTAIGRVPDAIEAGLAAVQAEPLRESAHRVLIAAHMAEGNLSEALAQYRVFARVIQRELGLQPSEQIETLIKPLTR